MGLVAWAMPWSQNCLGAIVEVELGCGALSPERECITAAVFAVKPGADEDHQEKCISQLYDYMPKGMTPLAMLKNKGQRVLLGA